jgi:parvulin-like peptidyl-prolyl isomerase
MKPGEVRVVQSQYGYHVIQVTAHATKHLSKSEVASIRQQKGQSGWQQWQTTATDPAKNKVNPANPYSQFPQGTPVGQ